MSPSVKVIVVNWNGKRFLPECLDGLRRQVHGSFTVTLVDNGSSDGSVEFVRRNYPEVEVMALSKNLGFAAANNIALEALNTEYVALLNNDAVPHPMWLDALTRAMERHPDAGLAASKMVFHHAPDSIDRAGDGFTAAGVAQLRGRSERAETYDQEEYVFGACAGAAMYRTDMLRDIGLFDEDFFLLYEDVDLSFRAQLRGYRCVFVPDAVVAHKGSSSIVHDSPISVYYSHRNLEWVYLKNMPAALIPGTVLYHLVYDVGSLFYFVITGRGRDFIRAKRDAMKDMGNTLRKRKRIQSRRRVESRYIRSLMTRETFLDRLKRRFLHAGPNHG